MIRALMDLALSQRIVVVGLAIALGLLGASLSPNSISKPTPDPVQPMVEVLTLPNGLSAEEVERMVTVPLEYGVSNARPQPMSSISLFGLSDIRCYFDWDSDYYWDREEVINSLAFVTLPQGTSAGISPENAIGEIYRYSIESPDHDLIREKEINDWVAREAIVTVPGVIGVARSAGSPRNTTSRSTPINWSPTRYRSPL